MVRTLFSQDASHQGCVMRTAKLLILPGSLFLGMMVLLRFSNSSLNTNLRQKDPTPETLSNLATVSTQSQQQGMPPLFAGFYTIARPVAYGGVPNGIPVSPNPSQLSQPMLTRPMIAGTRPLGMTAVRLPNPMPSIPSFISSPNYMSPTNAGMNPALSGANPPVLTSAAPSNQNQGGGSLSAVPASNQDVAVPHSYQNPVFFGNTQPETETFEALAAAPHENQNSYSTPMASGSNSPNTVSYSNQQYQSPQPSGPSSFTQNTDPYSNQQYQNPQPSGPTSFTQNTPLYSNQQYQNAQPSEPSSFTQNTEPYSNQQSPNSQPSGPNTFTQNIEPYSNQQYQNSQSSGFQNAPSMPAQNPLAGTYMQSFSGMNAQGHSVNPVAANLQSPMQQQQQIQNNIGNDPYTTNNLNRLPPQEGQLVELASTPGIQTGVAGSIQTQGALAAANPYGTNIVNPKPAKTGLILPDPNIPQPINCQAAPYVVLGQPTSNSISMKIISDYATTLVIKWSVYGAEDYKSTRPLKILPNAPTVMLTLSDLQFSTRYNYRVGYTNEEGCNEALTDNYFFHTQRYQGEDFKFAIIADTHFDDPGAYDQKIFFKTRENMIKVARSSPGYDFMLDLGDTFMGAKFNPPVEEAYRLYEHAFKRYAPIANSVPLFLVNGNHDGEHGSFLPKAGKVPTVEDIERSFPVTYARLRNKYFPNPGPGAFYSGNTEVKFPSVGELKNYYAWNWGHAFFVVLDPYWYTTTHVTASPWEWTLGINQYEWLATVLDTTTTTLKFIFIHQYVGGLFGTERGFDGNGDETYAKYFEWGGLDPNGEDTFAINRPGWNYGPIHAIFVRNHVTVVFRGHDHLYHVGQMDNVVYNTLPKPSVIDTYNIKERGSIVLERGYKPEQITMTSGHSDISVSKTMAVVSFLSFETNEILHQYTVGACCQTL